MATPPPLVDDYLRGIPLDDLKRADRTRALTNIEHARSSPITGDLEIGVEVEWLFVDKNYQPTRIPQALFQQAKGFGEPESGVSQFEWVGKPIRPKTLGDIEAYLLEGERTVRELAATYGLHVIPIGAIPNLHPSESTSQSKPRYQFMRSYANSRRNPNVARRFVGEDFTNVEGQFINGMHVNIRRHPDEASLHYQAAFDVAPSVVAVGGNSRVIAGRDSGYASLRAPFWKLFGDIRTPEEKALGVESGFGIPLRVPQTMEEQIERLLNHPMYVMRKEGHGTPGMSYEAVRSKFNHGLTLVEHRAPDVQPTAREATALIAMLIGATGFREEYGIPPLKDCRVNRFNYLQGSVRGLDGSFVMHDGSRQETTEAVRDDIHRARVHLAQRFALEEVDHYLSVLQHRVDAGITPAIRFAADAKRMGIPEAMAVMEQSAIDNLPYAA